VKFLQLLSALLIQDGAFNKSYSVIRLNMLAKSLTGDEIAHELINTLSVDYGVKSESVVAIMHDCASANKVVMCTLQVRYPAVLGICCFSHTLNRVGKKFNALHVNDFTTYWVSLLSHSFKARASKQDMQ